MEHDEQAGHAQRADQLEHEADKLEEEGERVGGRIDAAMDEWESKEQDRSVPGAQPEEDSVQEEPETVREREESDQPPEEGQGASGEEAEENAGVPGEEEQGTGNPGAAGSSDPEESG